MVADELWNALGAIGEVAGALAVFVTLLYLAAQVRHNTASTRASTVSSATEGWQSFLQALTIEDLDLLIRLSSAHDQLTDPEFFRGYYLCRTLFRRMEHDFWQYRAGTFDQGVWDAYALAFQQDTFNNPGIRAMWKLQSDFVDPAFREFIGPLVVAAEERPPIEVRKRFAELLSQARHAHP